MASAQTYARVAGLLFLISFVAGSFGEFYVPSKLIVGGDPIATINNIVAHNTLFRLGFAAYLTEALCDIMISLVMYALLRPVQRDLALLSAFFGLVSTAVFAVCELFFFSGPVLLGNASYLQSFSREQIDSLAYLFIRMYGYGAALFMVFYGSASLIRGYLIFRSGYLPRFLGVLLTMVGVAFILKNLTLVLAPAYSSDFFLLPAPLTILVLGMWLIVKGVDAGKWDGLQQAANIGRSAQ
ncbi:MAG TPA: DUF4386 domain-containing protein [Gemmatimonadaceae bacterium]